MWFTITLEIPCPFSQDNITEKNNSYTSQEAVLLWQYCHRPHIPYQSRDPPVRCEDVHHTGVQHKRSRTNGQIQVRCVEALKAVEYLNLHICACSRKETKKFSAVCNSMLLNNPQVVYGDLSLLQEEDYMQ